jgi:two-component system, response regulator PdtaR
MIMQPSPAATVLLVEDDFLVRDCAADALSEGGFSVLQAASAPEAMLLLEAGHVDVVFTDVNMPGAFDGLGLAQRVRHRWPGIAIVITSGRGWPDQDLHGAHFVPKPYMPDRLAPVINEALGCREEHVRQPRKLQRATG